MGERFGIGKNYHDDAGFSFPFGMFKMLAGCGDLTFEEFKGRKIGYELHSRKNYRTLIGRWMDPDMRCPVLEWTTSGEPTLMGKKLALAQL